MRKQLIISFGAIAAVCCLAVLFYVFGHKDTAAAHDVVTGEYRSFPNTRDYSVGDIIYADSTVYEVDSLINRY